MKDRAILVGPFIGELCWEFFRFAPYAIYLKKKSMRTKLIVLTRESRFDLYGQYTDVFVPLRLKCDNELKREGFKLNGYEEENYYAVSKYFKEKFKKKYSIIRHIYPDIRLWRYKVKWQFPRQNMNYDFKPREKNIGIARRSMEQNYSILDISATKKIIEKEGILNSGALACRITNFCGQGSSTLGCFIESIRLCKYVIGNIKSDISHLALLLGVPLINVGDPISDDFIKIINPLNTQIIFSNTIEEGIETYENNF